MKFNNLKEVITHLQEINKNVEHEIPSYLDYNIEEGSVSLEIYEALRDAVLKIKPIPNRIIDIGSNLNLFGYLFENVGIEYIGIDKWKDFNPVETDKIKFVNKDYLDVVEEYRNDVIISCLCVDYLVPREKVKAKVLFTNNDVWNYRGNKPYEC